MPDSLSSDETIFAAALERLAAERAAFLEEACAGDAVRRARIESLLRAHESAQQQFMATATTPPRSVEPASGEMIGRYKLLQKIGEGGCGVVFMAGREEPVRRRGTIVQLLVTAVTGVALWLGVSTTGMRAREEAPKETAVAPQAIFDALCRALRENYPMLEYAGWSETWVDEFRQKVARAPDRAAAFGAMDELVCRLNDYHTHFSWPDQPRRVAPPFEVRPVAVDDQARDRAVWTRVRPPLRLPSLEGVVFAVVKVSPDVPVRVGDVILAIEGEPVGDLLARAWPHAACSSVAGKIREACDEILRGAPGSALKIEVQRRSGATDERLTLEIRRTGRLRSPLLETSERDGIPVMRVAQWSDEPGHKLAVEFDAWLAGHRNRTGLIIDVRGNGGGSDALADAVTGRFLRTPVISSISFHRNVPTMSFERTVEQTKPRGPWQFGGRVVVLTDEGSMSASEHFVSGMAEAGALLCGTATSGACGWIRRVDLPGRATLHVSRTFPLHGGLPSPMLGMAPHLWRVATLADVRENRDAAAEEAVAWIRSGAPVPGRAQPVSSLAP